MGVVASKIAVDLENDEDRSLSGPAGVRRLQPQAVSLLYIL
jgi:hypothetical protein